jgi:Glycosyl hydrolase family 79 C-terminal beta domain
MHQGTSYRYGAWQPIATPNATLGTKPPYYGSIAVASMLGDLTKPNTNVSITHIPMPTDPEFSSAYGAYVNAHLVRVAILNLVEYNYTTRAAGTRPIVTYNITLPSTYSGQNLGVQRLMANGSNVITGITWDGYSYNWELDKGRPVLLPNVTRGERVRVGAGGEVQVVVPYSSMAILNLGG